MRVGIAGAGTIIPAFLRAQKLVDDFEIQAICATEDMRERLEGFASIYGIKDIYYDYKDMIKDKTLDIIYIAVPNSLHYDFSKWALESGKSVICEKPFCSCLKEAEELAGLSKKQGLYLFEAISNQYFPNYHKVKELLPELGNLKIVEMNYSQYSRRYEAFKQGDILPVFDPRKSGGALMDLNVYNIHFIVGLFGKPEDVRYYANMERGIDTSGVLVLTYPGFVCTSIGAKDCKAPVCINIQGDKGYIHSNSPANVFQSFQYAGNMQEAEEYSLNLVEERLYYEQRAFADIIRQKDWAMNEQMLSHSLTVQKILDEARKQVGIEIQGTI